MNQVATTDNRDIQVIQSPDTFIQQAIEKGSDVAVLSGLFDLKQRWEKDEAKKAFHAAMAAFQEVKPDLRKATQVKFNTKAGTTEYNFCPLPEMERVLREPLKSCGLTYRWESVHDSGRDGQRCVITHVQGHSESNVMFAPADTSGNKNAIQAIGSTATYLQRYTLVGALGLTTSETDDDGASSGDLPYLKLLEHNEAVRENIQAILAIKESLADEDYENTAMYQYELGKEVMEALWIAPSKGGIFTTKEVAQLKSDEMGAARREYIKSKGEQE